MNTEDEIIDFLLDSPVDEVKFNNGVMVRVVDVNDRENIRGNNNEIRVKDVEVRNGRYVLLDDNNNAKSPKRKILRNLILLLIVSLVSTLLIILIIRHGKKNSDIISNKNPYVYIKGDTITDKYGVELNVYMNGKNSVLLENDSLDESDIPCKDSDCPVLNPVQHSLYIKKPVCDPIQVINFKDDDGGSPIYLNLHSISEQLQKWEKWEKEEGAVPNYKNQTVQQLLDYSYHPYNYGYKGNDTSLIGDNVYYKNLIKSSKDEIPDPRRRRVFSFILLDSELDLLDIYLSENYELVDYFVIFESDVSFHDEPKPYYFSEILKETDRYENFKDKIIPLPNEVRKHLEGNRNDHIEQIYAHAKRTLIRKGLEAVHARHGDIYIYGSIKEMPNSYLISKLKKCGGWEHLIDGYGVSIKKTVKINDKKAIKSGISFWNKEYSLSLEGNPAKGTVTKTKISIYNIEL